MTDLDFQFLIQGPGVLVLLGLIVAGSLGWARALEQRARSGRERSRIEAIRPPSPRAPESEHPPTPAARPPARLPDLSRGLRKSRMALIGPLERLLHGRTQLDAELIDEIEALLFAADIGIRTAEDLLEAARAAASPEQVRLALQLRAREILEEVPPPNLPVRPTGEGDPWVVLVVGVNGSGKTTSIAKLAARSIREGERVLVAAADTFRAAAIEQLELWSERIGAEIVKGDPGGDPAAVAFEAVKEAVAGGVDRVIIDTAGRLHTDAGLMDQLSKIARVVKKQVPDAPHEVLLVLDGNTGQNAIRQAQEFLRSVEVDHILLSKLDGTAKGGVVLGIAQEVRLPVRYIGLGEGVDDLRDFDPAEFVAALFAASPERSSPSSN